MINKWFMADSPDANEVENISQKLKLPAPLIKILFARNLRREDEIKEFLYPSIENLHDPFEMKGMRETADRIIGAINSKEKIMIFGDYDADGITSTAMLQRFFTLLGNAPIFFIPNRVEDGYGLSLSGIDYALKNRVSLIVTVDCGITAFQEIEYAKSRGIDVVITDHHEVMNQVPDAVAFINPNRDDETYPFKSLAGCGVAFKLVQAISRLADYKGNVIEDFIDFVTLGTVADVVPLLGENRIISHYGLSHLAKTENPGISKLMEVSGIEKRKVTSFHIGFILAPRINAMGRMSNATNAVKLLITDDDSTAEEIANELNTKNRMRQEVDSDVFEEAVSIIESQNLSSSSVIVLAKENWHEGVIGIVASRLVEKYNKPTIMISISDGLGKGSGRSVESFHLYDALKSVESMLVSFGGHRLAAGLTIKKENIETFRRALQELAAECTCGENDVKRIDIDCEIKLDEITSELEEKLNLLSPFGFMNSKPLFASKNVSIVGYPSLLKEKHLRVCIKQNRQTFECIWFNNGREMLKTIASPNKLFDVAFYVSRNEYAGRSLLQLQIVDIKESDEKN
ncbi:MAG: single-stranded-DNA-specific exonuclease RecJ [bacterium]|nr:single-stranded-DNA-specific exonuclease RecJ [bacterium]